MTQPYKPHAWEKLSPKFDEEQLGKNNLPEHKLNVIDWIIEVYKSDNLSSILDVGCCTGFYSKFLRDRGYNGHYCGVDITEKFINRARILYSREKFFVGNSMDLFFLDNIYDLVFSVGLLQHLPDHGKAIEELFRVSKKYVIISCSGRLHGETELENNSRFINNIYSKRDLLEHVPEGWVKVKEDYKGVHLQFMFKRGEG